MMLWLLVLQFMSTAFALDNGLVLTPPMGWLSWQRFRCITDCKKYPNECISEHLIKRQAELMVTQGYRDAGYEYVGIDDCWLEKERDSNGRMVPDRQRFPNGMKFVSDYLHSMGFKFAMYQDYGTKTCAGYPGVLGHEHTDINTFVEWEIDYLKLDGCYIDVEKMDAGYPAFGKMMNATGRPIVYSCSWPAYQANPNYASISQHCNLWRNWDDIEDSYASMTKIMDWFASHQDELVKYAGPGHWNDPDMLLIGNFGLSWDQARVQMAVWSILAAPLLMSVDLEKIRPEFKDILLNKDAIAVDQDPLGKQGRRVWQQKKIEIWTRELSNKAYAVAFVSRRDDGTPYALSVTYDDMKIPQNTYEIMIIKLYIGERMVEIGPVVSEPINKQIFHFYNDIFKDEAIIPNLSPGMQFETRVNPTGVRFYKFIPLSTIVNDCEEDCRKTMNTEKMTEIETEIKIRQELARNKKFYFTTKV